MFGCFICLWFLGCFVQLFSSTLGILFDCWFGLLCGGLLWVLNTAYCLLCLVVLDLGWNACCFGLPLFLVSL